MSLKRPESVLVIIYDQHHRVLVMQRDDDASFWQSVTGTIEIEEQPIQTAYREVAEETGFILIRYKCPFKIAIKLINLRYVSNGYIVIHPTLSLILNMYFVFKWTLLSRWY